MYTSGVGIGMIKTTTKSLPVGIQQVLLQALTGCIVAVVGATSRGARASPTATGATRPSATTIGVFVFPGLSFRIVPLNPCTPDPQIP